MSTVDRFTCDPSTPDCNRSIYLWIKEWKGERLVDALKLSRASGIPIEKFAGGMIDAEQPKENK